MALQHQIEKWKQQYRDVYQIEISDREQEFTYTFIYRNIGRKEYNQLLLQYENQAELQEAVCKTCVLHPEYDFSKGIAGIAETLSNTIIHTSHLLEGEAQALLQQYREEMHYMDYQVDCIIHEAFPHIPLEEISNWTMDKTMYYLSRAEWILVNLRGVPLQYVEDPAVAQQQDTEKEQYQYNFTNQQQQSQSESEEKPQKEGMLSEQELMAMIAEKEAEHGRTINPNTNLDILPELNWFKAEEEVTGDFD